MARIDEVQEQSLDFVADALPLLHQYARSRDEQVIFACSLLIHTIGNKQGLLDSDENIDKESEQITNTIMPVIYKLCGWE